MLDKLKRSDVSRYLLVGGSALIIELLTITFLFNALGISKTLSVGVGFWVGLIVAFFMQKYFAFSNKDTGNAMIARQIILYSLLVIVNFLFTILFVNMFTDDNLIASRVLATVITTIWNFLFYKYVIFSNSQHDRIDSWLKKSLANSKSYIINPRDNIIIYGPIVIIVLFYGEYAFTGNKTVMGDFDYYSQLYEAARVSILKFHQIPYVNPWLSGGVPLMANPQYGFISIQTITTLVFGTIFGLKLAYILYAILGYFGMYVLSRRLLGASKLRSSLVGFIWVFCGFFTGHTIGHFTFTSFFLTPWVVYFLLGRNRIQYPWLKLAFVVSIIILSSIHYAVLMVGLVGILYFLASTIRVSHSKQVLRLSVHLSKQDAMFGLKTIATIFLLSGWQFIITYYYVSANERINTIPENTNSLSLLFQMLFSPVGLATEAPVTTWGWGEYSMYMGIGVFLSLLAIIFVLVKRLVAQHRQHNDVLLSKKSDARLYSIVLVSLSVGIVCLFIATGSTSDYSAFELLKHLPGFEQTRVPSRWAIFFVLGILVLLASWRNNYKIINFLLALAVFELFVTYGGASPILGREDWRSLPVATFNNSISQHDNGFRHYNYPDDPMNFYFHTTQRNIGQIYADDSIINTLSSSPLLTSSRCAQNVNPDCKFVMSDNAIIRYWSPNNIVIERKGRGDITLNMNVDRSWQINGSYVFYSQSKLDPSLLFTIPDDTANHVYYLRYIPKFSSDWAEWKVSRLFWESKE